MSKKVGMYGGKFLPFHQGHLNAIIEASTLCDELFVILSYDEEYEKKLFKTSKLDPIPYQMRLRWIRQATKELPHVKSIAISETYTNDLYDWKQGAKNILSEIGQQIDVVFSGEERYTKIFQELYPNAFHIVFDRNKVPISGTKIREEGAFKYWDYIPNVARPYYTKKVMIIGTESCGKSTLVHNLASYYNTNYVKEYGRTICEALDGYEDVFTEDLFPQIAYKQKVDEFEAIKYSSKLLFVDTGAYVTKYFRDVFTGTTDDELYEEIAKHHKYDLWLLLEPDVRWVDDGTRTMGEDRVREDNNRRLKEILNENNINYHSIEGNYNMRFKTSINLVDRLLDQ
ncbi:multifunctional transcriptional regulator/nicotinamide-nucleotide adenylyltransferase/ribosylnicotinamide kinase NadR [Haloplasma contractile]|uniref:Bifunctional NAD biosynthesis protein NadR n=1 Tax=Haloplasma contractile SSD-17B TaxID=1033810 RepID=F7PU98_9MOLU|nr:multifunctional transcriptional regulator/nicotinamide-nucleotide adenylyltransferase/ribosylnicotinamide kinase NadR [Haloplasma contractile]ERJ11716.1 Bifunctional NAD biosynthesis protein NadR [Haloplasma contractile SSD-17B]